MGYSNVLGEQLVSVVAADVIGMVWCVWAGAYRSREDGGLEKLPSTDFPRSPTAPYQIPFLS